MTYADLLNQVWSRVEAAMTDVALLEIDLARNRIFTCEFLVRGWLRDQKVVA